MICIIALVVFSILGIFSVSYRNLAKEAFQCVFRKITLKPCQTGFDTRMKGKITAKLLNINPKVAGFVHKHFELLSWIFTILFIVSLALSIWAIWNLITTGQTCTAESVVCSINNTCGV